GKSPSLCRARCLGIAPLSARSRRPTRRSARRMAAFPARYGWRRGFKTQIGELSIAGELPQRLVKDLAVKPHATQRSHRSLLYAGRPPTQTRLDARHALRGDRPGIVRYRAASQTSSLTASPSAERSRTIWKLGTDGEWTRGLVWPVRWN